MSNTFLKGKVTVVTLGDDEEEYVPSPAFSSLLAKQRSLKEDMEMFAGHSSRSKRPLEYCDDTERYLVKCVARGMDKRYLNDYRAQLVVALHKLRPDPDCLDCESDHSDSDESDPDLQFVDEYHQAEDGHILGREEYFDQDGNHIPYSEWIRCSDLAMKEAMDISRKYRDE